MGYLGFSELYILDKTGEVPNAHKCSMKAIIYDNPKYHKLFTKEEVDMCKKKDLKMWNTLSDEIGWDLFNIKSNEKRATRYVTLG